MEYTPHFNWELPGGDDLAEFDTQNRNFAAVDADLHNVSVNTAQARTDAQEALTRSIAANEASVVAGGQAASAITTAQGAQNTATSAVTIAQGAKNTADSALTSTSLLKAHFDYYKFPTPNSPSFSQYNVYAKVNKALGVLNIFGSCTFTSPITTGANVVNLAPLLSRIEWTLPWLEFYSGAFTYNPQQEWKNTSFIPLYISNGVLKTNTTPPTDDKVITFTLNYFKENTSNPVQL